MRLPSRSLSLMLAPVMVLAGLTCQRVAATNKQASALLIADAGKLNQTAPPAAGVALLEGIYSRLRGRLAMKQPMQIAQAPSDEASRDIYRIRPKAGESSGNYISYAPSYDSKGIPASVRGALRQKAAVAGKPEIVGDKAKVSDARELPPPADGTLVIAARAPVQQYLGANRLPAETERKLRSSIGGLAKATAATNADAFTSAGQGTNQDLVPAPQNVRSYNGAPIAMKKMRLEQISGRKTIAEEPRIIEYNPAQSQQASPSQAGGGVALQTAVNTSAQTSPSAAAQMAAPARQQQLAQAAGAGQIPGAANGTIAPQGSGAAGTLVPPPMPVAPAAAPVASAAQEEMKPSQPSIFAHIWNMTRGLQPLSDDEASASSARREIAMLPPRVVSGIPLVKLGVSALQTQQALGNSVVIKKQNIGGWNIWSVSRHNSKDSMLQLYLRSGVVEAIRVFDPLYLGPEIGVRLGDDLKTMLKQFSQPAFIIEEPAVSHQEGKNYVYPISHVSFELARSKDKTHTDPQVVSVLIFDVE